MICHDRNGGQPCADRQADASPYRLLARQKRTHTLTEEHQTSPKNAKDLRQPEQKRSVFVDGTGDSPVSSFIAAAPSAILPSV